MHRQSCCVAIKSCHAVILAVYRPPGLSDFELFVIRFESILRKVAKINKFLVVCGDFNIDLNIQDSRSSRFLNLLRQFNLQRTIFNPTRRGKTSNTCIDNIFTNIHSNLWGTETIETAISDHLAQQIVINPCTTNPKPTAVSYRFKRTFNEDQVELFCNKLATESWE